MNLNQATIIGRITKDPQLKNTPNGMSVATLGVATNRVWKDKSGQNQQEVEFHNVVVWGKQAEAVATYLTKGQEVMVQGHLKTRKWEDKAKVTHYSTEIIAEVVQFGAKPNATKAEVEPQGQPATDEPILPEDDIRPEDLPF